MPVPRILPFGYACALKSKNVAEATPALFARLETERVDLLGWTSSVPVFAAAIARALQAAAMIGSGL